jgi:hypothetical protein
VSYPPPPGPPDPRPQDRPGPAPGWQSQPYQPRDGNWAAPQYGGPPRKNRAGLIIALIVALVLLILGIGGFVAYRLTFGESDGPEPAAPPVSSPTAPPKPETSKPGGKVTNAAGAVNLAYTFVSHLNAGKPDAATALACDDTKQIFPVLIKNWIKPPTKLAISDAAVGQDPYLVPITGTVEGKKMRGMVIVQGSCVRAFSLSPS